MLRTVVIILLLFFCLLFYIAQDNTTRASYNGSTLTAWQFTTNMTKERGYHASVVVSNTLYVFGGFDGGFYPSGILSTTERSRINADGSLGLWESTTPLLTPRERPAAVSLFGYIYVLGGADNLAANALNSVERAKINNDGSLGSWQYVGGMNYARIGSAAIVQGDYIYVLGGRYGNTFLNKVERIKVNEDGTLGIWENLTDMVITRSTHGIALVNGYIYVLGGFNPTGELSSVERAAILPNGLLSSWQIITNMPTKRDRLAAVALENYIYAIGGFNGSQRQSVVERLSINPNNSIGSWQTMSPLNIPRDGLNVVAASNRLYAFGGYSQFYGGYQNTVERANIIDNFLFVPKVISASNYGW